MRNVNYQESSYVGSRGFSETSSFEPSALVPSTAANGQPFRSAGAERILSAPAQDPHVLAHEGIYYYCESTAEGIFVRAASNFLQLGTAFRRCVWTPPRRGAASKGIWAPELQWLDGRFYIYFAADDGKNENHRMSVLAALSNDPLGDYALVATFDTQGWAIDGTVLCQSNGDRFLVWSGWPGSSNGQQNLYIDQMVSPVELRGSRVLIATPDQSWERRGLPICEGPQVLQRDGRTFLIYSASGSWTEDYCLGLLAHEGANFLDPQSWQKKGPVFSKNEYAWGVGHCGFVQGDDGSSWLMYHAKTSRRPGWKDREVRAQRFGWNVDGTPIFCEPLPVPALPRQRTSARAPGANPGLAGLTLSRFSA
jgi:GH43 family beta-xylosidase